MGKVIREGEELFFEYKLGEVDRFFSIFSDSGSLKLENSSLFI